MIRSHLVTRLTRRIENLNQSDVDMSIKSIIRSLTRALASGRRIEIRGFGSFIPNYRPPHRGRNPRTGRLVDVAGYYRPLFKPSKELRERVDDFDLRR